LLTRHFTSNAERLPHMGASRPIKDVDHRIVVQRIADLLERLQERRSIQVLIPPLNGRALRKARP